MLSPSYDGGSPLSSASCLSSLPLSPSNFLSRSSHVSDHHQSSSRSSADPLDAGGLSTSDLTNDDTNMVLSSIISSAHYSNTSPTSMQPEETSPADHSSTLSSSSSTAKTECSSLFGLKTSGNLSSSKYGSLVSDCNNSTNANKFQSSTPGVTAIIKPSLLKMSIGSTQACQANSKHLSRSSSLPTQRQPPSVGPKISSVIEAAGNSGTATIELVPISSDVILRDSVSGCKIDNRRGTTVLVRRLVNANNASLTKESNRTRVVVDNRLILSRLSNPLNSNNQHHQTNSEVQPMNTSPTTLLFKSASTSTLSPSPPSDGALSNSTNPFLNNITNNDLDNNSVCGTAVNNDKSLNELITDRDINSNEKIKSMFAPGSVVNKNFVKVWDNDIGKGKLMLEDDSVSDASKDDAGNDGDCESVRLPDNLESIPRADHLPPQRHRWNTNEEIAALLISFDRHADWLSKEVKIRPKSGSMLLYSRKKVRYRRDGYCWKKRKDGKTTREDHMKLKVQGIECIYGCYVHSAILPTFHRRCYWLLQNPDIVLVHYLNVPYPDDNKLVMASSISLWAEKKEWTKEELISQLKPMFFSEDEPDLNNELEISTAETVDAIVSQLLEKQRVARATASVVSKGGGTLTPNGGAVTVLGNTVLGGGSGTSTTLSNIGVLECSCGAGLAGDHSKACAHHPLRRLSLNKLPHQTQQQTHHHMTPPHHMTHHSLHHHHHSHHHPQQQQHAPDSNGGGTRHGGGLIALSSHHHHHHHHQTDQQEGGSAAQVSSSTATVNTSSSAGGGGGTTPHCQSLCPEGSRSSLLSCPPSASPPNTATTTTTSSSSSSSSSLIQQDNINNNNITVTAHTTSNNNNNNKLPIITTTSQNNDNNNNSNSLNSASTPLILNLSTIQGGGGLLILNSGGGNSAHHTTPLPITGPLTLTSYLGQTHAITTATNTQLHAAPNHHIHHMSHHHINAHHQQQQQQQHMVHQHQVQQQHRQQQQMQQHHHLQQLQQRSVLHGDQKAAQMSQQHQMMVTTAQHDQQQHQQQQSAAMQTQKNNATADQSLQQHHQKSQLTSRECKGAMTTNNIMAVKKEVISNGGIAVDSGTFASLVSSLESGEQLRQSRSHTPNTAANNERNKHGLDQHNEGSVDPVTKDSFLGIKTELSELSVEKDELFSDTIDLSPEDIQKTLSANLPSSCSRDTPNSVVDVNPMDFIDNDITSQDDDMLANLYAFDMLTDFPELDHYDTSPPDNANSNNSDTGSSTSTNNSGKSVTNQSQQTMKMDYRENTANISDYSPEWAYPEGGVKVLVTGPWYSGTSPYTVLFDGLPTATTLVQSGVLRCYCPAHEAGLVTLQVACDGFVISNSVIFEYKKPPAEEYKVKEEPLSTEQEEEELLKFTLVQRFDAVESNLQPQPRTGGADTHTPNSSPQDKLKAHTKQNFEDLMMNYCQRLSNYPWLASANSPSPPPTTSPSGSQPSRPTVAHIVATLGYSRLLATLLRWREDSPSLVLDSELDALRRDAKGRTPLACAAAKGHMACARALYRFSPQAIDSLDKNGRTPAQAAAHAGHEQVADELTKLEQERKLVSVPDTTTLPYLSLSSPNYGDTITLHSATSHATIHASPDSLHAIDIPEPLSSLSSVPSSPSLFLADTSTFRELNPMSSAEFMPSNTATPTAFTQHLSPSHSSLSSSQSSLTSLSSHAPSSHPKEASSQHLLSPSNQKLDSSKLSSSRASSTHSLSVDYSSSGCVSTTPQGDVFLRPSPRRCDLRKHRYLSVDLPLSGGVGEDTGGRYLLNAGPSADGGASNSSAAARRARIIKRPSVDSGINLSHDDPYKRTSLDSGLDGLQKHLRSGGGPAMVGNSGTAELPPQELPPMLFDFIPGGAAACCTVQQPEPPEEDEAAAVAAGGAGAAGARGLDSSYCSRRGSVTSDNTNMCPVDDNRVLSLAETIIAALPERIKIDGEELMELQRSPSNVVGATETSELEMEVVILDDDNDNTSNDPTPSVSSIHDLHSDPQHPDIFNYRLRDAGTPCSSLSPASSCCLPSPSPAPSSSSFCLPSPSPAPATSTFTLDTSPTTADFSEFFHASARDFSTDFSNLTLSDQEQRELYEAAKIIQTAYRQYKGRKKLQAEQDKERQAAILIQNYYRRYKQYVYFTQMSKAATLIQNQFRSYCEHKRFKKGLEGGAGHSFSLRNSRESTPIPNLKRTYSQRRQHQAARKIQQFMRQTKQNSIWEILTDKSITERTSGSGSATSSGGVRNKSMPSLLCSPTSTVHSPGGGTGGPLIGALPPHHHNPSRRFVLDDSPPTPLP